MTYAHAPFSLHHPKTVAEATQLVAAFPGARFLAGGTDMMVNIRRRLLAPDHVISLAQVDELRGIQEQNGQIIIGAMTPLEVIAANDLVQKHLPALAQAAGLVAGPTLRSMGTLGGNLLLDTRCRFYNQSHFWRKANDYCLKKDGEVCHVAPGGKFCWAAFSADTPPVLLLLDTQVEIASTNGTRSVPLDNLYGTDGRWSTEAKEFHGEEALKPGELITKIHINIPASNVVLAYEKLRVRESIDFPLVGLGMAVQWKAEPGGVVENLRLALTGVNTRPLEVAGTEQLAGKVLDLDMISELSRLANKAAKPMRTTVADPAYRRTMVGSLLEKAAMQISPGLAKMLEERARWA